MRPVAPRKHWHGYLAAAHWRLRRLRRIESGFFAHCHRLDSDDIPLPHGFRSDAGEFAKAFMAVVTARNSSFFDYIYRVETRRPIAHSLPRPVAHSLPRPIAHSLPRPIAHSLPRPIAHSLPRPVAHSLPRPVAPSRSRPDILGLST